MRKGDGVDACDTSSPDALQDCGPLPSGTSGLHSQDAGDAHFGRRAADSGEAQQPAAGPMAAARAARMQAAAMAERETSLSLSRRLRPALSWLKHASTLQPWPVIKSSVPLADVSLLFLGKENPLRLPLVRLVTFPLFEWFMLLVIFANCITLAMDTNQPGLMDTAKGHALRISNYLFIGIFMVECACKIVAYGLVLVPHTYLRDGWNILDFIVVISGILDLAGLGNYSAVRCLRVLRPLRVVTKIEALRLIVQALMKSLPMLVDVCVLAAFYYTIFGITCLQLFMGELKGRCATPDFSNATIGPDDVYSGVTYNVPEDNQQPLSQVCKGPAGLSITWTQDHVTGLPVSSAANGGWSHVGGISWGFACPYEPTDNPNFPNYPHGQFCVPWGNPGIGGYWNFDNILMSWVSIYQHMAVNDWSFIMYATQGALSWWTWLLHVTAVILGCFFLVNLTLAVIFMAFNQHYSPNGSTNEHDAASVVDDISTRMDSIFEHIQPTGVDKFDLSSPAGDAGGKSQEYIPVHQGWLRERWQCCRDLCYLFQGCKVFEITTVTVIVLNAISLALTWYNMPQTLADATTYANYVFTFYFVAEMVLKLTGLGMRAYVSDGYNIFDGVVTIVGLLEVTMSLVPGTTSPSGGAMSAFRAFRLLRIFRLARSWKSLNRVVNILASSVESMSWLTVLLFLFLFIAGLLGMQFFGFKLDSCVVDGAQQMCPPGLDFSECPSHWNCYVECNATVALTWYPFPGSPYGDQAYCEVFPRGSSIGLPGVEYLAQVGKPETYTVNYDNIYQSILSVFVILTQDDYTINMFEMSLLSPGPWISILFTILVMIAGIYIVINLFLAILLSNLDAENLPDSTSSSGRHDIDVANVLVRPELDQLLNTCPPGHNQSLIKTDSAITSSVAASHEMCIGGINGSAWMPVELQHKLSTDPAKCGYKVVQDARAQFGRKNDNGLLSGWGRLHQGQVVPLPQSMLTHVPSLGPDDDITYSGGKGTGTPRLMQADLSAQLGSAICGSFALGGMHRSLASVSSGGSRTEMSQLIKSGRSLVSVGNPPWQGSGGDAQPMRAARPDMLVSGEAAKVTPPGLDNLQGRSLYLLGPRNRLRAWLARLVDHTWFEYATLAIIVGSCVALCFDDITVAPGSIKAEVLHGLNIAFTAIFGTEAFMKIIVAGLAFNGSDSYLRSPWNCLDMIVVVVGVLVLALENVMNSDYIVWLRAMRAFRLLRPMKHNKSNEGLRVVVLCILGAVPAILEVILVASLFYFIFAVLGVFLLAGKLFYCADSSGSLMDPYYYLPPGQNINRTWCEVPGGVQTITNAVYYDELGVALPPYTLQVSWGAHGNLNRFDNVLMSLWVLFQMASLENWSGIMYEAMATTSIDEQPVENSNAAMGLYFIIFIIVCVYFVLNMVIGVSIDRFDKLKKASSGRSVLLTESQHEWLNTQRMMAATEIKRKYAVPCVRWRQWCYHLVLSSYFENLITLVILLNILTMFLPHASAKGNDVWEDALSSLNAGFTGLFISEMLLKWAGIGFCTYFQDGWCQFDFVVVVVSVAGVLTDYLSSASLTFVPLLRVLRVLRIVKLIPKAKGLRMLMMTLLWTLPAFLNVTSVVVLVMFIYSIIGMNLFGAVKLGENLDRNGNFQTFPTSMLLLFRMIVGENWNGVMLDCMVTTECVEVINTVMLSNGTTVWAGTYFDPNDTNSLSALPVGSTFNRCSPNGTVTILYFCSYMLIMVFLLIQLVIAIILENCEMQSKKENYRVSQTHLQSFIDVWESLDPSGSGFIPARDVTHLLLKLPPPVGILGCTNMSAQVQDVILRTSIPIRNQDKVHFLETLHALSGRVAGVDVPADEEFLVHNKLGQRLPKDTEPAKYTLSDYHAALWVKSAIQGYLLRVRLEPLMDKDFKQMRAELAEDRAELLRLCNACGSMQKEDSNVDRTKMTPAISSMSFGKDGSAGQSLGMLAVAWPSTPDVPSGEIGDALDCTNAAVAVSSTHQSNTAAHVGDVDAPVAVVRSAVTLPNDNA